MTERIGIAGAGNAAGMHATAIAGIESADVVAVANRTESRGRDFASTHDCEWYPSTSAMLEAADLDVLLVSTPSGAHLEPAVEAAERGVDVLCEKPLEVTSTRIDEMVAAAAENDVRLGGVFQQRYNPVVRTVQEAAAAGRFGDLAAVTATVPWWRDDEYYRGSWKGTRELDGGGALMNQSIHSIDALVWLASAGIDDGGEENPVAEVVAFADALAHDDDLIEVEDTAVAILRFRDGTLGQLLGATSMYPGTERRVRIAGRDGTAVVHGDELETWEFRDEETEDEARRAEFGPSETSGGAGDPTDVDVSNHRRNVEAFLEARRTGEPFLLDASEARKAVEVVEAIYASAERGERVRL